MADKKKKQNRFTANHPPIDPNDPAILITAGLFGHQNSPAEPQEPQKEETAVVTPEEPETPQEAPEAPVSEPVTEPVVEAAAPEKPAEEKKAEPDPAPVRLILEDLIPKKKKPKRGTYGFYLDSDVHDELVKIAKQSKTNKSEVLNALLRRVLFDE